MAKTFRFTVQVVGQAEDNVLIKLRHCNEVIDGMLFVESATIFNAVTDSAGVDANKLLAGISEINICSTSLLRTDSYDSRSGKESEVLKCIPLSSEYLIGADDGINIECMHVNFVNKSFDWGIPIKRFDFSDTFFNVSLKNHDLGLIADSRINHYMVNFMILKPADE